MGKEADLPPHIPDDDLKFIAVFILVSSLGRRLPRPLEDIQLQYLKLLELTPDSLVTPYPRRNRIRKRL